MKKLFFAIAVVGLVGLASCSKEKDCTCTTSMTGFDDVITEMTIEDGECSDADVSTTVAGITTATTCKED